MRPSPLLWVFGILAGLLALAAGGVLVGSARSATGAVGAGLLVVVGVIVLLSAVGLLADRRPRVGRAPRSGVVDGEPATFHPRSGGVPWVTGILIPCLLGLWAVAMGVAGLVEGQWLWAVLLVVPAVYFLGFGVLAAAGRLRPGGVWLTATRVVDEDAGQRSELRLAEIGEVLASGERLLLQPVPGAVVRRRRQPWPWGGRSSPGALVIRTRGIAAGADGLAAEVLTLRG